MFQRKLSIAFTSLLLISALSLSQASAQEGTPSGGAPSSSAETILVDGCGAYYLSSITAETEVDGVYDSSVGDVSAICLTDGASLILENPTITKTGDTSSADSSSFYGLNAAVLVGSGSTISITGGTVITDGDGTNGAFATGTGSTVILSDMYIEAIGDGAHAVMATLEGTMILDNVVMYTTGAHSGAVATDRGSGTITVTGGEITTTGQDSPGIYSTGVITVTDALITATGAEAAVIEGSNSIVLVDSDLISSIADKWGVMLYQSFSGDAEGMNGEFTMTGGSLAYTTETGPLFFITNATGIITLSGVDITAASGILVQAGATERWGTAGENGGIAILSADAQNLTGDLLADSISGLSLTLQNGSTLTGAINPDAAAQSADLTLDASSTWSLTADSHLSAINGVIITEGAVSNISGNGFNVYYDASLNSTLNGQTYLLADGGYLMPGE